MKIIFLEEHKKKSYNSQMNALWTMMEAVCDGKRANEYVAITC